MKHNVDYLGKYIKRPPIGETRIKKYDGKFLTFEFLDHYTNTKDLMTLPILDFFIISQIKTSGLFAIMGSIIRKTFTNRL